MPHKCKSIGCHNPVVGHDFCEPCQAKEVPALSSLPLSEQFPDQYKPLHDLAEIDVYAVHHLFQIRDHSGCLQEASRKLLMSGSSLTLVKDVQAARDLLSRWLQLNQELPQEDLT